MAVTIPALHLETVADRRRRTGIYALMMDTWTRGHWWHTAALLGFVALMHAVAFGVLFRRASIVSPVLSTDQGGSLELRYTA